MKAALFFGAAAIALYPSAAAAQDAAAQGAAAEGVSSNEAEVQEANDADAVGGEIIVTAQKRAQSLQRVPAAITAVGGETLSEIGIFDQSQLSKMVPGLTIGAQGGNGVAFIRGVGQTQGSPNLQPGVSINTNGVYLPRESGTTPLYDVARVEVLPGPQGTLWGRNSAGGAINFVTNRPVYEFEASAILEVGNYELIHPIAVLNVPVGDTFAVRAAGEYHKRDGFLSNGAYDRDSYSGRLSLLFEPTSNVSAFVMGSYTHEGGIGAQSIFYSERGERGRFNPVGNIYQQTFPTEALSTDRDLVILQGEFTVGLTDAVDLTYVPGFVDIKSDEIIQFMGTTPSNLVRSVRQHSHELRLSNSGNGALNWVLGAFLYKAKHDFLNTVGVLMPRPVGTTRFYNELDSKALFGQATYSITDNFRATLGGRFSSDEFDGFARSATPPRSEAAPLIGRGRDRDERIDYKLGLEADLSSTSMLYGTVQTGYLVGGFTQDGQLIRPATLTAYTLGSKNRFLDGQLTANAELYYYDYPSYQLQAVEGNNFININSPAIIKGIQLDLIATPSPANTFNINMAVQDTQIRERNATFLRNGIRSSIFGFSLPNAPTVTITAGWDHRFELANGGSIDSRIQTYFSTGYWMVFTHDLNTRQPSYTVTDLTLTYSAPGGRWKVGAFVRNLEDEAVFVGANKPAANALAAPYVNPPRTYGARVEVSF